MRLLQRRFTSPEVAELMALERVEPPLEEIVETGFALLTHVVISAMSKEPGDLLDFRGWLARGLTPLLRLSDRQIDRITGAGSQRTMSDEDMQAALTGAYGGSRGK